VRHEDLRRLVTEWTHLNEGGAAGHLQHLYDNLELTFGEIKDVISKASEGKLEKASEKLDGMNLVFTFDVDVGLLRVARTGSDIKNGGMDAAGLAKKFFGRGNVEVAFNAAFKVLNEALTTLPENVKAQVFGENGNRWYSLEIIYAADPNTISYDSNNVVFHGWPIFNVDNDGVVEQVDDDAGVQVLSSRIEQMQKAISMKDWRVRGPSLLNMKQISDGTVAKKAIDQINAAMSQGNVNDESTVFDYLRSLMQDEVANLNLPDNVSSMVVERAIEAPDAPSVPEIKRVASPDTHQAIAAFIRSSEQLKQQMIAPIEGAIHQFAIEVLRGLKSTLIARSDDEVARLRTQVAKAIKAIEASGNQAAMDVLQKEMQRLGNVENIGAAMEGVVFFYKGQAYKFTGAFAPAHQILSLFKYGRKGIPKMDMGESITRHGPINEGGYAFNNVSSITLSDFKETWPFIKDDLETLGCTKVEFIGSTGKKPVMGDVDLAAEFPGPRDELLSYAQDMFGKENVDKVGATIVTISYPVHAAEGGHTGTRVQVDVMLGKTSYLKWSRFGTSSDPTHVDYSPAKGVARNVLINVITRFSAGQDFPGQQTELDRTRYAVDFDKGLYKVTQTKRNKNPGGPQLKDWRTVERKLISDDPDEIVRIILGPYAKASSLQKVEDVMLALRRSRPNDAQQILQAFANELRVLLEKTPKMLGNDPQGVIRYIDQLVAGG